MVDGKQAEDTDLFHLFHSSTDVKVKDAMAAARGKVVDGTGDSTDYSSRRGGSIRRGCFRIF